MTVDEIKALFAEDPDPGKWMPIIHQAFSDQKLPQVQDSFSLREGRAFRVFTCDGEIIFKQDREGAPWYISAWHIERSWPPRLW